MLYITTRSDEQTYTAKHVLEYSVAPDGGRFVPQHLPVYDSSEITAFVNMTYSQTVAHILNTFFDCHLSSWDVELVLGKSAPKLVTMNHRIAIAELWRNQERRIGYIADGILPMVLGDDKQIVKSSDWFRIAVGIAVLFGVYGEMLRANVIEPVQHFDISVPAGDFSAPMAGFYARNMGLPIELVVCTCDEESSVWDIIQRGSFITGAAQMQLILGVERLACATLSAATFKEYRDRCNSGRLFTVPEEEYDAFSSGFFCAVAGKSRASSIINRVYRNNTYLIDPYTALCYGGLQDYRAKHGGGRIALLPAQFDPVSYADDIKEATGVSI